MSDWNLMLAVKQDILSIQIKETRDTTEGVTGIYQLKIDVTVEGVWLQAKSKLNASGCLDHTHIVFLDENLQLKAGDTIHASYGAKAQVRKVA